MMKTMTTAVAKEMVEKIERLQDEIAAIYADVDMNYLPVRSSSVIRDIIKARAAMKESEFDAAALLGSFDAKDE